MQPLTPAQHTVATRFLEAQGALRRHVVVSLSGAHAYGFPSPDSDLDLKAIHVEPTRELLGLAPRSRAAELLTVIDGVEVDYSSNELAFVLRGLVDGNGNYLERVLGHLQLVVSPELEALVPLTRAVLSRRFARHYLGFARQQHREWEATGYASAKRLLYVLRTALTGARLLRAGELQTDVTRLIDDAGLADARELIAAKTRGEMATLPEALSREWRARTRALFERLEAARDSSALPAEAPGAAVGALEAWLLELRRRHW